MNPTSPQLSSPNSISGSTPREDDGRKKVNRTDLLRLIEIGLDSGQWRFVRQLSLAWLATYPGDLQVNLKLAKAWLGDDRPAPARTILERLVTLDPEFLEAWTILETIYRPAGGEDWNRAVGTVQALGGRISSDWTPPIWAAWVRDAYNRLMEGRLEGAERSMQHADAEAQALPISWLIRLRLAHARKDGALVSELAKNGKDQWPDTLGFQLAWAERCMEGSEAQRALAVQAIHRCAAQDACGQVAKRLWGEGHSFVPLWPEKMEIYLDLPIPVEVSKRMGLNRLDSGPVACEVAQVAEGSVEEGASGPIEGLLQVGEVDPPGIETAAKTLERLTTDKQLDDLRAVEQTFERLARQVKSPQVGKEDGRFPVYVVFSCRAGLVAHYGEQTTTILLNEMEALAENFKKKQSWDGELFLADDSSLCANLGVAPVLVGSLEDSSQSGTNIDPWKLKLALTDLDRALAKKGKMIGAVLIVGGPDVVPFHRLPNPADDGDREVLSDNPYATLDANYFVPEWPVGRLPGEPGTDAGLLMGQLRQLNRLYAKQGKNRKNNIFIQIRDWFAARFGNSSESVSSTGYTAAVWRNSSEAVFRVIGKDKRLVASPPEVSNTVDVHRIMNSSLGYFNLHGLPDSGDWYGQRDVMEGSASNSPDYPVALRSSDLVRNGRAPKIIFSEACYGAHIVGKTDEQAIALRFLSLGTSVVVGSTCVSYGSVVTPLIGADLLASLFWRYLQQGLTAGQAFIQAKIELAQEMNRRQGYLDGEDQKSLISFVLYGDPMMALGKNGTASRRVIRLKQAPQIQMVPDIQQPAQTAAPEMVRSVKLAVEKYLPGLEEAEFSVRARPVEIAVQHETAIQGAKKVVVGGENKVVTISKQVQVAEHVHSQVAHVTLNEKGKMVKIALSR